jgi:hypothetical protein
VTAASGSTRFRRSIAVLIVVVSVLGAVVSWRAAVWAGIASGLDREATQTLLLVEQARTSDHGQVAEDLRVFDRYRQEFERSRLLAASARRQRHRAERRRLRLQADESAAIARVLAGAHTAWPPERDGRTVRYDAEAALDALAANKPDLADTDPDYLFGLARDAHDKTVQLVLIGTLLIASLFFLTVAEVIQRRMRRVFAAGGLALCLGATAWFALQTSPLPSV